MGRRQTEETKRKLRAAAQARRRAGGRFEPNPGVRPFARFINRGGVLRDTRIGQHVVRYWPPGAAKSVPPEGVRDAELIEQLERIDRAD